MKDTRNIVHRAVMPQSPSKEAPWDLTQFSQSPPAAPSYFPKSHWWSEISSLSKEILVWGKARGVRTPNLGFRGSESPARFDVSPKNCMRCDVWPGTLSWWSCQSPVAHSCGLLHHPNSSRRGMFKLNAKLDEICCCTCSVILNVMATQCTCSLSGVYHPHWLVQWSCHCSCMCIPVHSPWLPGYINVMQTILVILTMAGFFLAGHYHINCLLFYHM